MVRVQAQLFKDQLGSDNLTPFSEPLDCQLDSIPKATTFKWFCKFLTNGLPLLKGLFEQLLLPPLWKLASLSGNQYPNGGIERITLLGDAAHPMRPSL